jgi:hypothetical protein
LALINPEKIFDPDGGTVPPVVYDPVTYDPIPSPTITYASGPVYQYYTKLHRYPGNNKQWWLAKAEADDPDKNIKAGDFLPELLQQLYSGNNKAPRGHFILNQFRKDRSLVSGVSGFTPEDSNERPNSVAFFSGRAWFGCQSTVYYSQILDSSDASKAGRCYQEADPTAEDISDLTASDGGVVPIPEADHIEALCPLANGVMVFAQNGVWFVSGGDSAFSALNVSVSKVSPIGTKSPGSIVETDGTIFWWSEIGIQALQQASGQFGPIPGRFGNTNIAEQTVQSFYNDIPSESKHYAKSLYDPRNNLIIWLYSSGFGDVYEYDSMLLYDLTLQAFYPWKVTSVLEGPRITGLFLDQGYEESGFFSDVTDDGDLVVDVGTVVQTDVFSYTGRPSNIFYLTQIPEQGLTVAAPVSFDYVDWYNFNLTGGLYDSYIVTGYELNNDAMRDKQIVYLFAHFKRTEDNLGNNPSSCKLIAKWDWAGSNNLRWSSEVEAYRPRTINLTDVVTSKNKVRGHGKSVQFRFGTNERGKTFDLLGWSVGYSGTTQP